MPPAKPFHRGGDYHAPVEIGGLYWHFVEVVWFLIMVDLTLSNYLTRGALPDPGQSWRHAENGRPALEPGGVEAAPRAPRYND